MNWFKYRLPNTDPNEDKNPNPVVSGASHHLLQGLGEGFAVAPFINSASGLLTIPSDFVPNSQEFTIEPASLPPSTSRKDYYNEIEAIKTNLHGCRGKTVAARAITFATHVDINLTFNSLCEAYPEAFVFAFSTSETGTWIGASPELLLRITDDRVSTMALAGTRPASPVCMDPEWDEKNKDEQKMVEEFIRECLEKSCIEVQSESTFTKKAGSVEHICTPITAKFPTAYDSSLLTPFASQRLYSPIGDVSTSTSLRGKNLLSYLSPTPAVCGSDREKSLEIISRFEKFPREMYGGFCGPSCLEGISSFYVILRSAKCSPDGICIFAGGGITPLSDPEAEWLETEMKSKTIINKLKTSE